MEARAYYLARLHLRAVPGLLLRVSASNGQFIFPASPAADFRCKWPQFLWLLVTGPLSLSLDWQASQPA